ncbi:hypothetical protein Bca52824_006725 [Brassica carinata]|uniref:Mannosyl-oligosaccharide glucosidase n=1 Tax=Brassica carinata TaxID=52824 RepID=A0A8X8B7G3_BRACI|nr:hypothetical protein Bca52824_006725 [Brassica carinata]
MANSNTFDNENQRKIQPAVITPFPAPKVMELPMFKGEHKESLYWGTYRPQAYFGVRASRDPRPLVAGLMWLGGSEGKPVMRHFCEDKDGLKSFGWKEHNGIDYGHQILVENDDLVLETSFVKSKVGSLGFGGDWSVRIHVENSAGSPAEDVGNWQLHLRSAEGPPPKWHYCGFKKPNSVNLSDFVQKNLDVSFIKSKSGQLSDTAEDDSNVYVFQISSTTQSSTIDIAFISGIDVETAKMEDRTDHLTGLHLTNLLEKKHDAFDDKFKECFNLSEELDGKTLAVGKAAIANMLGGIGYFYGQSKVHYLLPTHPVLQYWSAELYTAVPCRPKLPWGLLGDEGFHQMLIWFALGFPYNLDIVGHWLDLMNELGWIPREQLLGAEALRFMIEYDHVQYPDVASPPTLLLVLCDLIDGIQRKKFKNEDSEAIVSFLEGAFGRLEAWFKWLYTSQKGKKERSFYWRGREKSTTEQELNPRTVASGMDDYPRASHPSDDEMHVDLRCWIYLAADCMKSITEFLKKKETEMDYSSIVQQLSDFPNLNKMHYDRELETYLDFGNHTEKVRNYDEPELKKVPHVGYASLFPFMSKIILPKSQILEEQLDLILSDKLICSDYGVLSLAKTSSLYMKENAPDQPPCWRGPIWMNMNYMILASLKHYSGVEGDYKNKARDIYEKLRNNLISNMAGDYAQTGYNQTNGTGEGGRDFTGWSSLILLIMTQDYPSL